jgi:hypothetical protein
MLQTAAHGPVVFSGGITIMDAARLRGWFGKRFEQVDPDEIVAGLAKAMMKKRGDKEFTDEVPLDLTKRELNLTNTELEEFATQVLKNLPGLEKNNSQDGDAFKSQIEKIGVLWRRSRLDADKRYAEIAATLDPRMAAVAEAAKKEFDRAYTLARMIPKSTLALVKSMEMLTSAAQEQEAVQRNMLADMASTIAVPQLPSSPIPQIVEILRDLRTQNDAILNQLQGNNGLISRQIADTEKSGQRANLISYVAIGISVVLALASPFIQDLMSTRSGSILQIIADKATSIDDTATRMFFQSNDFILRYRQDRDDVLPIVRTFFAGGNGAQGNFDRRLDQLISALELIRDGRNGSTKKAPKP